MTNAEKLANTLANNTEEFARFIFGAQRECNFCKHKYLSTDCEESEGCIASVKEWLESEVKDNDKR